MLMIVVVGSEGNDEMDNIILFSIHLREKRLCVNLHKLH